MFMSKKSFRKPSYYYLVIIASGEEETKEEEKDDSGQVLDLSGQKHDEGAEAGDKKKDQGLSIEEMPAATIRETLLNQKNR